MGVSRALLDTVVNALCNMAEYVTMKVIPVSWIKRKERKKSAPFSLRNCEYRMIYRSLRKVFDKRRTPLTLQEVEQVGELLESVADPESLHDLMEGMELMKDIAKGQHMDKHRLKKFLRCVAPPKKDAEDRFAEKEKERRGKREEEGKRRRKSKRSEKRRKKKKEEPAEVRGEKRKSEEKSEKEEEPKKEKIKSYKVIGVPPGLIPNDLLRRMHRQGLKIHREDKCIEDLNDPLKNLPSKYYTQDYPRPPIRPYSTYGEDQEYLKKIKEEKTQRNPEEVLSEIREKVEQERSSKEYQRRMAHLMSIHSEARKQEEEKREREREKREREKERKRKKKKKEKEREKKAKRKKKKEEKTSEEKMKWQETMH